jgi:hypothetical protein
MRRILRTILSFFTGKRTPRRVHNDTARTYPDYTGYYPQEEKFGESFYENLRKTIACTQDLIAGIEDVGQVDCLRVFRSINPVYEGKPFYIFHATGVASGPDIPFNYHLLLKEIMGSRPDNHLPLVAAGKILRFEIDITTLDGAAAAEHGFVDVSDIPPIDTWFYITKKYLYCWIPTMFIGKMQDAIDVEIFDSYKWLEQLDPALNLEIERKLQER